MKSLFIVVLVIALLSCISSKSGSRSSVKLEIVSTDSIRDYFVFNTKSEIGHEMIILAEKRRVADCKPFKKFIIEDSIHRVSAIKSGSRYDLIGFNVSIINGVKIRDSAELVKIIWNCNCFIDN